jgi:hypothetical protein
MIRLISTKRFDELEETRRKHNSLSQRVESIYWLSGFSFMRNFQNWLKTGCSYDGKFYNVTISGIRDSFYREVDDFYKNTLSMLQDENIKLKKQNERLIEAISTLKELNQRGEDETNTK